MRILSSLSRHENVDEEIIKERNKIASKAYILMQIIATISIPIVMITNMPWYNFLLLL